MASSTDIMEAIRHYASVAGAERPDQAWIEHPSFADSWTENPHYKGPPVPHPMSDFDCDDIDHEPPETGADDADWSNWE